MVHQKDLRMREWQEGAVDSWEEILEQSLPPTGGKARRLGRVSKTSIAILPRASFGLHDGNRGKSPKPVASKFSCTWFR